MSHQCPRPECSRSVPDTMFACRGDWYALPADIRDAIWAAYRADDLAAYAAATGAARAWYDQHPPRYATQPGMARRYVRAPRDQRTPRATRTAGETGDDRQ